MKALALDSVSKSLSISLFIDENIYEVNKDNLLHSQNVYLIPTLDELLKEHNTSLKNIDFIAIGTGPGSFTALRICFSTIKTLVYANNTPLIGVPSLLTLYQNIKEQNGVKAVMIDARKGSVYISIYSNDKCISDTEDLTYEEAIKKIENAAKESGENEVTLLGDGYINAKEIFDKNLKVREINESLHRIYSKNTYYLALERYKKNDFDDIFKILPIYARKAEAEILYEKNKK